MILPRTLKIDKKKKLEIQLDVGYSSVASDLDNAVKPLLDVLQKKYGFNDRNIYKIVMRKHITKKGDEFFEFKITEYNNK